MSKTSPGAERAAGTRLWRGMAITALVLLVLSLVAGLLWFFADPLDLPPDLLATLDQRASVFGMAAGLLLGTAGLVVALVALHAQTRAGSAVPAGGQAPQAVAEGERSAAVGGDNPGIISTGDGTRNTHLQAQASGHGKVYQAGGDQTIHQGDDHRRSYGGDHIEFHHNTLHGKVVGKQVNGTDPATPDGDGDGRR
jgi:hypothetical protein